MAKENYVKRIQMISMIILIQYHIDLLLYFSFVACTGKKVE